MAGDRLTGDPISGVVADATGAVLPGVRVSVTDTSTGVDYSGSATNDRGVYQIVNLPVGKYSLMFRMEGFKQYEREGVTVSASQEAKVDVNLQVGGTSATVTVTSDAAALDSYTSTEATSVEGSAIQELPLSIAGGRNAQAFAVMVVPSVNVGTGVNGDASSGISIAGSLSQSNNVMVDGVDADAGYQGGGAASSGWGNASPGVRPSARCRCRPAESMPSRRRQAAAPSSTSSSPAPTSCTAAPSAS